MNADDPRQSIDDKRAHEQRMADRMAALAKAVEKERAEETKKPEEALQQPLDEQELPPADAYMVVNVLQLQNGVATVPVTCIEDRQKAKAVSDRLNADYRAALDGLLVKQQQQQGPAMSLGISARELLAKLGIVGLQAVAQPVTMEKTPARVLRNREKAKRRERQAR